MFTVDLSEGSIVILKSERPLIFSDDGDMDCYLGEILRIGTRSEWNPDGFELEFIVPNQVTPINSSYSLSDWIFDDDCVDIIKTYYLQLFLNALSK